MPSANPKVFQALKRHLERECKLYESYLEVLHRQRDSLTYFKADEMTALNEKRAKFSEEMQELEAARFAILKQISSGEKRRLTDTIRESFVTNEKVILLPLAERLKTLVQSSRRASQEFHKLTHFALNMVNGSLSIFSHATQNVTKCYNPTGKVKESYSPTASRHERVIKSA